MVKITRELFIRSRENRSIFKKNVCYHTRLKSISILSELTKHVECLECSKIFIIKNHEGIYNNFYNFNECFYYEIADLILNKYNIKNNIPKRSLSTRETILLLDSKEIKIKNSICFIDYIKSHSRISRANEKNYNKKLFPSWLYWIDFWLGRLDCYGDSNLIIDLEKKEIIPIDFDLIGTWSVPEHTYSLKIDNLKFIHFKTIKDVKDDIILREINKIKKEDIIKIFKILNKNLISKECEDLYIDGLLKRSDLISNCFL